MILSQNNSNEPKAIVDHPKVSVVIPVYNRADKVKETLDSVLNQSYRPLQLILVDDGSSDKSLNALNIWAQLHQTADFEVEVYHQVNSGAPLARNLGMQKMSGRYLQFLDSDDFLHPEKIEIQVRKMISENSDFCVCDFQFSYSDGKVMKVSNGGDLKSRILHGWSVYTATPIVRSDILKRGVAWGASIQRNQDVEFFFKLIALSSKVIHIPKVLCDYNQHDGDQISNTYKDTRYPYDQLLMSALKFYKSFGSRFSFSQHVFVVRRILGLYLRYLYNHNFNSFRPFLDWLRR